MVAEEIPCDDVLLETDGVLETGVESSSWAIVWTRTGIGVGIGWGAIETEGRVSVGKTSWLLGAVGSTIGGMGLDGDGIVVNSVGDAIG